MTDIANDEYGIGIGTDYDVKLGCNDGDELSGYDINISSDALHEGKLYAGNDIDDSNYEMHIPSPTMP